MIKDWMITAWLASPLCGEPPALDALLAHELSYRLGSKHHKKLTRAHSLDGLESMPIPVAKRTISGVEVYCCSNPVIPEPDAEWHDYQSKRIDTSKIALLLAPENRKNLLTASGPYKMRHVPLRIRLVDRVCWFVRCDRAETNKLLKSIKAIGKGRGYGYGIVRGWDWTECEDFSSIWVEHKGKRVIMRTLPLKCAEGMTGYRHGFGGWTFPYWHPENGTEIAIPC